MYNCLQISDTSINIPPPTGHLFDSETASATALRCVLWTFAFPAECYLKENLLYVRFGFFCRTWDLVVHYVAAI